MELVSVLFKNSLSQNSLSKTFECTDIYTRHGKGNGLAVYEGEIKNQFYDNFLTENSNIQVTQFFVY